MQRLYYYFSILHFDLNLCESDPNDEIRRLVYLVLGNDKLRSAKYLRNIMRIKDLHHDWEPMVARVTGVIDQLKEHESQEEIKANEIFVGRDRDIQLSLGLLGVQSGLTDELCREDLDFIRKQSLRVKGGSTK